MNSHHPKSQVTSKEQALNPENELRRTWPRCHVSLEKSSKNHKPLEKWAKPNLSPDVTPRPANFYSKNFRGFATWWSQIRQNYQPFWPPFRMAKIGERAGWSAVWYSSLSGWEKSAQFKLKKGGQGPAKKPRYDAAEQRPAWVKGSVAEAVRREGGHERGGGPSRRPYNPYYGWKGGYQPRGSAVASYKRGGNGGGQTTYPSTSGSGTGTARGRGESRGRGFRGPRRANRGRGRPW